MDPTMYGPITYLTLEEPAAPHAAKACLVEGCPCKDARIVSLRRARFFASVARGRGQTADRVIAPEPGWELPFVALD